VGDDYSSKLVLPLSYPTVEAEANQWDRMCFGVFGKPRRWDYWTCLPLTLRNTL
jgi:hypothetical protein